MIFGDGTQTRDFTWVEETARGIVAAAACDELVGEAVNIAYGHGVSIREVCEPAARDPRRRIWSPSIVEGRPGDVDAPLRGHDKAREVTRFRAAVPIREGLERYVAWAEEQSDRELAATATGPQLVARCSAGSTSPRGAG